MSSVYTFKRDDLKKYLGDEPKAGTVTVLVDWEKIVSTLGAKAAFSAGKKARALNGAIVVKFKPAPFAR
jgi:hypothetical protein